MERTRVSSSNIRSIGYDVQDETLEVEFGNGGIYQYFGVSQQLYERFMAASSKGTASPMGGVSSSRAARCPA